ncbi:very short patch repair endonuclease [Rhodoligotrophos defluvii]|uniref:very short patch repair endonuclease n=1 Tax=Rhodoligotrophos defluvii TaxID=2561934 RepID=UPI0010C9BE12|nr:DNA mismatch endonuclease Vsr [Rhodoligotrophos defluvii]
MNKSRAPGAVDPKRSALMARVRQKDTTPEMIVRRVAHGLGYRFRLHRTSLPGSPDLVFPSRRVAVFVHGCFWHRHEGCPKSTVPKTRQEYWLSKFKDNVTRDERAVAELELRGWLVIVIWECETTSPEKVAGRLKAFLEGIVPSRSEV